MDSYIPVNFSIVSAIKLVWKESPVNGYTPNKDNDSAVRAITFTLRLVLIVARQSTLFIRMDVVYVYKEELAFVINKRFQFTTV